MQAVTARMRTDSDVPSMIVDTVDGYDAKFEEVLEFVIGNG